MKPWYRRRAVWRLAFGPLLTLATAGALLLLARSGIQVPGPGAFMLGAIFVSSYIGGAAAGSETLDPASTCLARLVLEPSMSTASVANKIGGISLQDGSSFRNGRNCRGGVADVLVQVVAGPGPYGSYCDWAYQKS